MGCSQCEAETKGYKCTECGAVSDEHNSEHACGGDKCLPMCTGCNEAEAKCTCGGK